MRGCFVRGDGVIAIGSCVGITRPEVEALLKHVTFRNAMIPMQLSVGGDAAGGPLEVLIDRAVIDREAPGPDLRYAGTVRSFHTLPWATGATVPTADVLAWLRNRALREVMLHELDEWIHIDGERVFDPHRDDQVAT